MKIFDVDFNLKRINFIMEDEDRIIPLSISDRARADKVRSHLLSAFNELRLMRLNSRLLPIIHDLFVMIICAIAKDQRD